MPNHIKMSRQDNDCWIVFAKYRTEGGFRPLRQPYLTHAGMARAVKRLRVGGHKAVVVRLACKWDGTVHFRREGLK